MARVKAGFYRAQLTRPGAVLAPMAGYSDAPMRRLASEHGALWTVSEMLSARGVLEGAAAQGNGALELGRPYPGEVDRVVQLFGAEPEVLAAGAARAVELFAPAALDLNMGCPVPKLRGRGGACLLQTPEVAYALVRAMRGAVSCDVSAKIRLGWDLDRSLEIAQGLQAAGAALVTVHGRTSAQRYTGEADWEAIGRVAGALSIPVVGSGDVTSAQQARARLGSGVATVMVGRGAVGNPWLFAQVAGREGAPTTAERAATARRHAELNAGWYGERRGLLQLRKVLPKYFPERPDLATQLQQVSTLAEVRAVLGEVPHDRAADPADYTDRYGPPLA